MERRGKKREQRSQELGVRAVADESSHEVSLVTMEDARARVLFSTKQQ